MKKIMINCDGGSRGNPGPAAIGIVLWDENRKVLVEHKECIGPATNNVAEYRALRKALEMAKLFGPDDVEVFMDSEVVVKQMRGEYAVKAHHLKELHLEARALAQSFPQVTFRHVRREDEYQARADEILNQALDGC